MRILLLRPDPGNERFGLGPWGARRVFELMQPHAYLREHEATRPMARA